MAVTESERKQVARVLNELDEAHAAGSDTCSRLHSQWVQYQEDMQGRLGWEQEALLLEGALLILDLRHGEMSCFLCNWFNEYSRYSERDQLSFSYVYWHHRHRLKFHFIPRRLHWSVKISKDTAQCFDGTDKDAATLAVRYQHKR